MEALAIALFLFLLLFAAFYSPSKDRDPARKARRKIMMEKLQAQEIQLSVDNFKGEITLYLSSINGERVRPYVKILKGLKEELSDDFKSFLVASDLREENVWSALSDLQNTPKAYFPHWALKERMTFVVIKSNGELIRNLV